ncbi:MAG: hypothetical protein FJW68_04295 [Actinobacteria bacterium]|nr:hypothetical protein [Actinomycetota bacterium]
MIILFRNVVYLYLILIVNIYMCSYFLNKLSSRVELKRGFSASRAKGLGYPVLKLFRYLSKDDRLNIWEILIFFFSFFIWTIIPFSPTLIIIRFENDLVIAILFYMILLFLILMNASRSRYGFIFKNATKNILMIYNFFIPVIFCISGIVLINRTLTLKEIVGFQYQYWNIIYQPLGFIVMFASALLLMKLFNITKKSTLFLGQNIEKEGYGFGRLMVRISYYSTLFFIIVMIIILYLAGWQNLFFINGNIIFGIKFYIIFLILVLLDKATPQLNDYSYLLSINWKFLIPVAAVNFLLTIVFFILRNIYGII